MMIIQNCLVTKLFALSVSSVKLSPSFSSVGIEEYKEGDMKDF